VCCTVVATLTLSALAVAGAPAMSYRLAGIVEAGGAGSIALIELPDGRQRLFRSGDALGEGRIREITAVGVRIELAEEDLILRLRGNPRLLAKAGVEEQRHGEGAQSDDDEAAPDEEPSVRSQKLAVADAARMLTVVRRASSPHPGTPPPSDASLHEQLAAMLEMPAEARITAVDDIRAQSAQDAIETLASRLETNGSARLTVSGAGPVETIVVTADSEQ
jgi:hypothetical protein